MTVERFMRVGRPRGVKDKTKMVCVRLAPQDVAAIKEIAKNLGVSVSGLWEGVAEGSFRVVRSKEDDRNTGRS